MSGTEEVPVEKPKRKIWKIVVPVIVVAILIPSMMYVYGYIALGDAYSKSWRTFEFSEEDSVSLEQMREGIEVVEEATIHNPTSVNIHFIKVDYDYWVYARPHGYWTGDEGGKHITMRETNVDLPAGGSTTLTYTQYFDYDITAIKVHDSYDIKVRREVVASTKVLFITVTRIFLHEYVDTIYPVW